MVKEENDQAKVMKSTKTSMMAAKYKNKLK